MSNMLIYVTICVCVAGPVSCVAKSVTLYIIHNLLRLMAVAFTLLLSVHTSIRTPV